MNRIKNINNISDLAIYDTVIRNHSKILIKDRSICDDIVNDVYIVLDKYFKKYPNKKINGGFVSIMIRNLWKNHLKKITNKFDYGDKINPSIIPDKELDNYEIEYKENIEGKYDELDSRIDRLNKMDKTLLKRSLNNSILKISRQDKKNYHKLLKRYHNIIKTLKNDRKEKNN